MGRCLSEGNCLIQCAWERFCFSDWSVFLQGPEGGAVVSTANLAWENALYRVCMSSVCMYPLWVLRYPPTAQKRPCDDNLHDPVGIKSVWETDGCSGESKWFIHNLLEDLKPGEVDQYGTGRLGRNTPVLLFLEVFV